MTAAEMAVRTDATVENHGSVFLVRPLTSTCRTWLADHTDGQWFGGALAVEHRYIEALVDGMIGDGLEVT